MSLLTIVSTFCLRSGLPVPIYVRNTQDAQVLQIKSLLDEVLEDLCDRWVWQALTREAVFTTVAGEDQGAVTTHAPHGFLRILRDTIYNRTQQRELIGSLSPSQWQAQKTVAGTGLSYHYRIRGGRVLFTPAGVAGETCAFEYATSYAVLASDGSTYRSTFLEDSDTCLLDEKLLTAGLRWKWRLEKGLDYAEEFRRYEELANNASARDTPKRSIVLDCSEGTARPGIVVPDRNWPLS